MKKLFIINSNNKNFYFKYLFFISRFFKDSTKIESDDQRINKKFLEKFDVIIFNSLSENILKFLEKKKNN